MPASAAGTRRLRLVAALAGLAIAAAGVPGWFTDGASAASTAASSAGDGSDWNSTGSTASSSAVTVSWGQNDSNPASSKVPRDGSQSLPHTDHKTYDDISSSLVSSYFDAFGPDNGFGGLKMKVSQTKDLVNQSVNLTVSGVKGGQPYGFPSSVYLQVFQCWGGVTASGAPDPGASQPDPATCQVGAGDAASHLSAFNPATSRYINNDPVVPGGDWAKYLNKGNDLDVPFTSISGTKSGSTNSGDNQFFNPRTTNEISRLQVSASGSATRQFEVQTSLESAGMGCGKRRGQVTTASCWLVVVPRIENVLGDSGAITPSLWAQRMQVRLGFRDIVAGCPSGQDRTLTIGSELLSSAAASWTPGLCDSKNIALGYTQIGDPVARVQYQTGAADGLLTTEPADKAAVYAPVALTAPVITYALSYQPKCAAKAEGYTEEQATGVCGYSSLAALNADILRSGTLVRNLKLDARLVAKLLTQSYIFAIFENSGFHRSGWMVDSHRASSLIDDPEFLHLNPDLAHISRTTSAINNLDHLVVEALRSDAASQVWKWILADPDAKSFLNGCPDANGMTINPFYSTRSYEGCESQASTLSAAADAARRGTDTASTYADLPLSYPPDGSPYPLTGWQESITSGNPTFGVFDFLPPVDSMPVAGRDVAIGYLPRNSNLCLTVIDFSCQPAPGKWTDPKTRQSGDQLGVMSITTAAIAAQFQLPTAQLCDTSGDHCVGASTASLQKAAANFTESSTKGVLEAGDTDSPAGAYPLTMPVYLGVNPNLPLNSRQAYAEAIKYITTTGQKPGYSPGNLPAGYAPLTKAMRTQAAAAIAELNKKTPTTKPSDGATNSGGSTDNGSGGSTGGSTAPDPSSPGGVQTNGAAPTKDVELPPGTVLVSSDTQKWPRLLLPIGLGITLLAGLAGPALRFRGSIRIG